MSALSPSSDSIRSALREVDKNLRDVQKLCPTKSAKLVGISDEVMAFRSKIQEWYTKLERASSPLASHLQRRGGEEPASIPILSPVSSPQSEPSQSPLRAANHGGQGPARQRTPERTPERARLSNSGSDGFPLTPQMCGTPSTCDVLGHKKRELARLRSTGDPTTPEFPALTPAGMRSVGSKKAPSYLDCSPLDLMTSNGLSSQSTPNLDSTPTTTIQLSPSHFVLDNLLEGKENDGGDASSRPSLAKSAAATPAAGANGASPSQAGGSSTSARDDIEEKLMSSLYIGSCSSPQKKPKDDRHSRQQDAEAEAEAGAETGAAAETAAEAPPLGEEGEGKRAFDITAFPSTFRSGKGSVELESVYRKVEELRVLRQRDIKRVFPQFEEERVSLLLEVLDSRDYIAEGRGMEGTFWKVC